MTDGPRTAQDLRHIIVRYPHTGALAAARPSFAPVATPGSTPGAEAPTLARKPNYGFEKRKKELDRKAKKDAKREDRRRREEEARGEETGESPPPADTEPGSNSAEP